VQAEIRFLASCPQFVDACAAWAYGLWGIHTDATLRMAIERFRAGAQIDDIPMTLVASLDNNPVGMVSLWANDFSSRPDLTPWLASLYVHPNYRGRGYAQALVNRIEGEARRQGYSWLHLVTGQRESLYARLGWLVLGRVTEPRGPIVLMRKRLNDEAKRR
jgi:GNAT superfamily N-acetyltransferase